MKTANGRSEIRPANMARMSFRRESTVQQWIADNTVPSKSDLEGVTTNLAVMPDRLGVKFTDRSAVHPAMDEEIV